MLGKNKYYVKIIVFIVALFSIFQTVVHVFVDPKTLSTLWQVVYVIALILVSLIVLWWGQNPILALAAKAVNQKNRDRTLLGNWHIQISFDESGTSNVRTGNLEIVRQTIGYEIKGGRLYDVNQNETMTSWEGHEVNFLERDNADVLVYIYNTFEKEEEKSDRVGVVVAGRSKDTSDFQGSFHDFSTNEPGESLRHGLVRIIRA